MMEPKLINCQADYTQVYMEVGSRLEDINFIRARECYIGAYSHWKSGQLAGKVEIGRFCRIGPKTKLGLEHPNTHNLSISPLLSHLGSSSEYIGNSSKKLVIGHDVCIEDNAIILSGLNIGHGAVIRCGAIVTKDIPPYAIVEGKPARIIGYRFSPEQITSLLSIEWWNLGLADLHMIPSNIYVDEQVEFLHAQASKSYPYEYQLVTPERQALQGHPVIAKQTLFKAHSLPLEAKQAYQIKLDDYLQDIYCGKSYNVIVHYQPALHESYPKDEFIRAQFILENKQEPEQFIATSEVKLLSYLPAFGYFRNLSLYNPSQLEKLGFHIEFMAHIGISIITLTNPSNKQLSLNNLHIWVNE